MKPVTWRERLVTMMKCARWNRCDCPICGLDAWGEGCRNGAEKICPLILDYLEGLDFPLRTAVANNEKAWRAGFKPGVLERAVEGRTKFRAYRSERNAQNSHKKV